MSFVVANGLTHWFGRDLVLEGVLVAEPVRQAVGDDKAHSGGVLISGQSTNGPARNSRMVATMMAIAPMPAE